VLPRASRSTTIDVSSDEARVVMTNPDSDSISVFSTTAPFDRTARVTTGDAPSAVVVHPNSTTAFVANQGDATVVRVDGLDTASPSVGTPIEVGSEPTGLALSPTGALLFVAEWGQSRVAVIRTSDMAVIESFEVNRPYAIGVTNDGDEDDMDEVVIVPEFFGRPNANGEANNQGRTGAIQRRALSALDSALPEITLSPVRSGFGGTGAADSDFALPNQLFNLAIVGQRVYLTSIAASPEGPVRFDRNVHPIVYVVDLASGTEDTGPTGHTNLARLVDDAIPMGTTRHHLGDIVGIDFVGTTAAYVVSRAANVVQRVDYGGASPRIGRGPAFNQQIDVGTPAAPGGPSCQVPTGIVTLDTDTGTRAFVNCWASRRLGVVILSEANQRLESVVESSAPPTGADVAVNEGLRFFFTGRGRWSNESWSSCASCHPGGLTDNVTWAFGTGPRQSTSLDGSFSHGPGTQRQRVFNWTAIFDEMHDFERNTRGTSGGRGAITAAADGTDCAAGEVQQDIGTIGGLARPLAELAATGCMHDDWDDIDAWVRTIRPPRGRRTFGDAAREASIARGRTLFMTGNCNACHGGPGWTASRRFWTPSAGNNTALATTAFARPAAWLAAWNDHTTQIQAQLTPDPDPTAVVTNAPPQVSCVIRNVGTFGVLTGSGTFDAAATATVERRDTGARAQGAGGYNIPSLYGLPLAAPFLHHGQATDLFGFLDPNGPWDDHVQAANPLFLESDTDGSARRDLVNFLYTIDASTPEIALQAGHDGCPPTFP
jgi:cytochrome c peroxidase